jgi:DNA-binding response OmpR family regulator
VSAPPRVDFVRRVRIPLESGADNVSLPALNIAIVTDDTELAEACARVLLSAGHNVRLARHSGHAQLLCLSGERVDLLLVELAMPDGSGPSLMRRMRRYSPDMQCVYLARTGSRCEADNVLVRPFTAGDLLGRLRAVTTHSAASS